MTIIEIIRLALFAYSAVAPLTKSTADEKIVAELSAMLDEYEKVHGSDVTKVQVESLKTKKVF